MKRPPGEREGVFCCLEKLFQAFRAWKNRRGKLEKFPAQEQVISKLCVPGKTGGKIGNISGARTSYFQAFRAWKNRRGKLEIFPAQELVISKLCVPGKTGGCTKNQRPHKNRRPCGQDQYFSSSTTHSFLMRPTRYCSASTMCGRMSPPISTYMMSSPTERLPSLSHVRI